MTISDSTLETDVWTTVRTNIVAASIITSVGATTSGINIAATYPEETITKPQVIIHPVMVDEALDQFGSNYGKRMVNVVISCFTNTTVALAQLMSKVKEAMRSNTLPGLSLTKISDDVSYSTPGENKVFEATMTFVYLKE